MVGSATRVSVSPGAASLMLDKGSQVEQFLGGVTRTDADVVAAVSLDKAPVGGPMYVTQWARRTGPASGYAAKVLVNATGSVSVQLTRFVSGAETTIANPVTLAGVHYTAGMSLTIRVQATGTAPTALRARVWPSGQTEPTTWQVNASDPTTALQQPGAIGVIGYLSTAATNGPITLTTTSLTATPTR
jgi:hypothetical protein